jgi:hypothetical protein
LVWRARLQSNEQQKKGVHESWDISRDVVPNEEKTHHIPRSHIEVLNMFPSNGMKKQSFWKSFHAHSFNPFQTQASREASMFANRAHDCSVPFEHIITHRTSTAVGGRILSQICQFLWESMERRGVTRTNGAESFAEQSNKSQDRTSFNE